MRYLGQQATLDYHWFKVSKEGVDSLLNPGVEDEDTRRRAQAHRLFLGPWLGDMGGIDRQTALDFRAAMRAGLVPEWVLDIAPLAEVQRKAR